MANARLDDYFDPLAKADELIKAGKADDAVDLLEALQAAGRGGILLQRARVTARIAAGDLRIALAIASEAVAMFPDVATMAVTLGEALLANNLLAVAIGEFQRALRIDPDSLEARTFLGIAWLEAGEADKAADEFAKLPEEAAGLPAITARLADIEAMRMRPRSDARYVRHLFDQFSADYDERMIGQLGYGAPQILRSLADMIGLLYRDPLSILDLGCGTGLSGAAFFDLAVRLDGIDLSPAMVEKAKARGIYNDVRVGDIETAVGEGGYDLVLAADTLVYLGDLEPVFRAAAKALVPGGAFLFTVERKEEDGYELGPKRRWRHSEKYLRGLAAETGFDVTGFLECSPRSEAGVPVQGYAVALSLAEKVG
jgi:predicted TPR repeat methyltransferase